MVEERTKKLSDGTAEGKTLGRSPEDDWSTRKASELAKQHRQEGPSITPRLKVEDSAIDLGP